MGPSQLTFFAMIHVTCTIVVYLSPDTLLYSCPCQYFQVMLKVSFLRTEQLITEFITETEDTFSKKINQQFIMRCTNTVRSTEVTRLLMLHVSKIEKPICAWVWDIGM